MEITFRDAATIVHGMFFGALLLLTFAGAAIGLYAISAWSNSWAPSRGSRFWTLSRTLIVSIRTFSRDS